MENPPNRQAIGYPFPNTMKKIVPTTPDNNGLTANTDDVFELIRKENPEFFPNGLSKDNYNGAKDRLFYLKDKDGKIIGFKGIQNRDGVNYLSVGLLKEHRGNGIAKKQLIKLMKEYPEGTEFKWTSHYSNEKSKGLLKSLQKEGFNVELKEFGQKKDKTMINKKASNNNEFKKLAEVIKKGGFFRRWGEGIKNTFGLLTGKYTDGNVIKGVGMAASGAAKPFSSAKSYYEAFQDSKDINPFMALGEQVNDWSNAAHNYGGFWGNLGGYALDLASSPLKLVNNVSEVTAGTGALATEGINRATGGGASLSADEMRSVGWNVGSNALQGIGNAAITAMPFQLAGVPLKGGFAALSDAAAAQAAKQGLINTSAKAIATNPSLVSRAAKGALDVARPIAGWTAINEAAQYASDVTNPDKFIREVQTPTNDPVRSSVRSYVGEQLGISNEQGSTTNKNVVSAKLETFKNWISQKENIAKLGIGATAGALGFAIGSALFKEESDEEDEETGKKKQKTNTAMASLLGLISAGGGFMIANKFYNK